MSVHPPFLPPSLPPSLPLTLPSSLPPFLSPSLPPFLLSSLPSLLCQGWVERRGYGWGRKAGGGGGESMPPFPDTTHFPSTSLRLYFARTLGSCFFEPNNGIPTFCDEGTGALLMVANTSAYIYQSTGTHPLTDIQYNVLSGKYLYRSFAKGRIYNTADENDKMTSCSINPLF